MIAFNINKIYELAENLRQLKGGAVKLVDRLEFAHQNFNAAKNWSK